MSDLDHYRNEFPHTRDHTLYFDHAAVSPMCSRVREKITAYMDQAQGKKINNFFDTLNLMKNVRADFGRLINAPAERISTVKNTTDGMILLARGLKWQPNDRIILHRMEFPSNVYPWYDLKPFGVELDFLDTPLGRVTSVDLDSVVTEKTRLVTVSWVQYLSGYRNDIASLADWCHERDIILAVDGMQGLGALSFDVQEMGIDFLSTGTAKWMLGPQGIGFIYLTQKLQNQLHPPQLGWHSRSDMLDFHNYDQPLKEDASRFEYATPFSIAVWGVSGALELLLEVGIPAIEAQILFLTDHLASGLTDLGFVIYSNRNQRTVKSGILTVSHPQPERNEQIFHSLVENNVTISRRDKKLRISPHFYNTEEELGRFIDYLATLV